jgi:hypothetical protein
VDDRPVAGLLPLLLDHDRRIARFQVLNNCVTLIARALAHRYASANRAYAHADTRIFSIRNVRNQAHSGCGYQDHCYFHVSFTFLVRPTTNDASPHAFRLFRRKIMDRRLQLRDVFA